MRAFGVLGPILALSSLVSSSVLPALQKRGICPGNTPTTRSTWCDYSIDTDYYNEVPDTGVTREFWLSLQEGFLAPDGRDRYVMTVNGTFPGPTLIVDWGDTVKIHVTNNLPVERHNGSSIHFHGIRQNFTNQNDGVVSITQCPIAPGTTQTYTWRAEQYGHTWYHSHFALQAWEGVFGGIIINGPATANYDEDLGVLFIQDWDQKTVDELFYTAETVGPTTLETGLINGTNTFTSDGKTTGSQFKTRFEAGKSYRMRLVNSAVDQFYSFSIDNHNITIIANDLVPIEPFTTDVLPIGIGQRYDIIVHANQANVAQNFWMRAVPQNCRGPSSPQNITLINGIVFYGDSAATPSTSLNRNAVNCLDVPSQNLVPHLRKDASASFAYEALEPVTVGPMNVSIPGSPNPVLRWRLNGTSYQQAWGAPTLLQVLDNVTDFDRSLNLIETPDADQWVYLIIDNDTGADHPIHLHGHDFYVLHQSPTAYDPNEPLNLKNPTRRDVAMLPHMPGHLVLAWQTDNPGAWLMHCHIGFHQSEGFALQFLERRSEIEATLNMKDIRDRCAVWNDYMTSQNVIEEDSGI